MKVATVRAAASSTILPVPLDSFRPSRALFRLVALPVLFALPAAAAPPAAPKPVDAAQAAETARANRALVRRYLEEVLAGGHQEKLDEIVAKTFADRSPGLPIATARARGAEVVRKEQAETRSLFSEIRYSLQSVVADGDRVAAYYLVQARRKADGKPGAGQAIAISGMAFYRIANGRIEEAWVLNDKQALFKQLGYVTTAPKAAAAPAREPHPGPEPPAAESTQPPPA